jgi:hypothetical protein
MDNVWLSNTSPAQLTQVERDKNEQGSGNDSFVNNHNNNALE